MSKYDSTKKAWCRNCGEAHDKARNCPECGMLMRTKPRWKKKIEPNRSQLLMLSRTKINLLDFCRKGRTWTEILNHLEISKPTLLDHLTKLKIIGLLKKQNGVYYSSDRGLKAVRIAIRIHRLENELENITNGDQLMRFDSRLFPMRPRYKYPEESLKIQKSTNGRSLGDDK